MPNIQRLFTLEVSPAKFIESCTRSELYEVLLLVSQRLNTVDHKTDREAASEGAALRMIASGSPMVAPEAAPEEAAPEKCSVQWTAANVALLRTLSIDEAIKCFGVTPAAIYTARSRWVAGRERKPAKKGGGSAPAAESSGGKRKPAKKGGGSAPAAESSGGKERLYDINKNGALTGIML